MQRAFVTGGSGFVGRNMVKYLVDRKIAVRALARSADAAAAVEALGAEAVRGDLNDAAALASGMAGCDVVFHAAAYVKEHGPFAEFVAANVDGTRAVLEASRAAGVKRVVHVSTEAVLAGSGPLVNVDETRPLPKTTLGHYGQTKAMAERVVQELVASGVDAVIVRPRLIWGKGDTSLLPQLVDAVNEGRFAWISGGHYPTSTCHVQNVCHGMFCAAERGKAGEAYFLTDGPPMELREFLTAQFQSAGVQKLPTRSVPRAIAYAFAATVDFLWETFSIQRKPPVNRLAVVLMGGEVTVDDSKARRELGYAPIVTRPDGLAGLAA